MIVYRGMTKEALDAAYNNRAVVKGWQGYLARWTDRSSALYGTAPCHRDLRYGPGARQRIDVFSVPCASRPTVLFLHGGYWQWNDKEGQAFVAEGLLPHRINVAVGEYTLAPHARMDEIVAEAGCMVSWLLGQLAQLSADPRAFYVCGISTGAHLAATTLGYPGVRGALLISGIYDLEPIRLCWLNEAIRMTAEEAMRNSPIRGLPGATGPIIVACGGAELPEIRRQSLDFHTACKAGNLPVTLDVIAGEDHFSILELLAAPDGHLAQALVSLISNDRKPPG